MMQRIIDKIFLLICSSLLYYFIFSGSPIFIFIPILLVVLLCAVGTFFRNNYIHFAIYLFFLGICCFFPLFTIFIPVVLYELEYTVFKWSSVFSILPFFLFWETFSPTIALFTVLFLALSILLFYKTSSIELLQNDYQAFRETARELTIVQEEKSQRILENQDYEIETATLNERNRISKEIHDHVGHLLSRSLIQIGALLTISKEEPLREGLTDLKTSISEGMDRVRDSIHNMHDESIDLERSIQELIRGFSLCPILFSYQIHFSPPLKVKYCFIAITKEALANIIKHGKEVTEVSICLTEEDSFYLFSVEDNGIVSDKTSFFILKAQSRQEYPEGLGLQSMSDRVKGFNGNFHIQTNIGFQIKISIPKGDIPDEFIAD